MAVDPDPNTIKEHVVNAYPGSWQVQCPVCSDILDLGREMHEGHDGQTYSYYDDYDCEFIACDCGTLLRPA